MDTARARLQLENDEMVKSSRMRVLVETGVSWEYFERQIYITLALDYHKEQGFVNNDGDCLLLVGID